MNRVRGLLIEFGIVIARSPDRLMAALPRLTEDPRVPDAMQGLLLEACDQLAARRVVAALFASVLLVTVTQANCGPITLTFGHGSAIDSVDRMAKFDSLTADAVANTAIDLSSYTEGGLAVHTVLPAYATCAQFSTNVPCGIWYAGGFGPYDSQSQNLDLISTTDGRRMRAVEFTLYAGNPLLDVNLLWEVYRNGHLLGSGEFATPDVGTVIGWRVQGGMDELRVGIFPTLTNGSHRDNAIGIDNLAVQTIPEPSTALLALLALSIAAGTSLKGRKDEHGGASARGGST